MKRPNLFSSATSELSQDAFICWLLSWAKPENKKYDAHLHACGMAMIQKFFEKHDKPFPNEIRTVEVKKQDKNIDVLCIVNGEYPIIIEDKTRTSNHGDQLAKYFSVIKNRKDEKGNFRYKVEDIIPIYFKTYDQSCYKNVVDKNKYQPFTRADFLVILNKGVVELGISNAIFEDFREHLQGIENRVQSYQTHNFNDWTSQSWVGFYLKLQQELGMGNWDKVNNPAKGFMGFSWGGIGSEKPYLQLEQHELCFKVRVEGESKKELKKKQPDELRKILKAETVKRRDIRNKWYKLIKSQCTDYGIALERPANFGNGKWMTVIKAKDDYLHKNAEGIIDIHATVQYLQKMDAFLKEMQKLDIA